MELCFLLKSKHLILYRITVSPIYCEFFLFKCKLYKLYKLLQLIKKHIYLKYIFKNIYT